MGIAALIVRRVLEAILVVAVVCLLSFLLFRYIGDPVNNMVGADTDAITRAEVRARLHLDDPPWVQAAAYAGRVLRGDFGLSLRNSLPVGTLLVERLPATAELVLAAFAFSLGLGVAGGVFTAVRPRSWISRFILHASLAGISLPTFVTGMLLILFFGVWLEWLPTFGRGETRALGFWTTGYATISGLQSLVLPALTLGLFQLALFIRLVNTEMGRVLRAEFVRFARARGIPERLIELKHALRSALLPVLTIAGLQFGTLMAFSIVTESLFQWPGLGLLLIQAIQFADVPVIAAYLLVTALLFVGVNLLVDLAYYAVDPRLRVRSSGP